MIPLCEKFINEIKLHFNEPMLSFGVLSRCVGYGEDDMDAYVLVKQRDGKIIWNTLVGGYTFLNLLNEQNKIISTEGELWTDLSRLDNELERNGCPKEKEFILIDERTIDNHI